MDTEKQIDEMARFVCSSFHGHHDCENCSLYEERCCVSFCAARRLYNAGYRKQIEAEWITDEKGYVTCSNCGEEHTWDEFRPTHCDMCGAKMKEGEFNGSKKEL